MKRKYYHCSPKRLPVGTMITGVECESGYHREKCAGKVGGPVVFLTSSPKPHFTILTDAKEGRWHIYEVEPIGKIDISDDWDEYVARTARVVKFVRRVKSSDTSSEVRKRPYVQSENDYSDFVVCAWGQEANYVKQKKVRR